ncbi:MAG TPA: protein kinase [Drouetiella sp.]
MDELNAGQARDNMPGSTEFRPGQIVGGRYAIESFLGQGGMGLVFRVKQIFIDKEFALKTLNSRTASDRAIRRFQREAKTLFSLDHPSIVTVNDFGVLDDQTPFIVMELLKGKTLADRLIQSGRLTVDEAIKLFVPVCFGLAYAHERGIVHRDIKASNIFILDDVPFGTDGSIKIVDFGIAKFKSLQSEEVQALTQSGEIFGSPLYMSPEQGSGSQIDHRSDIYSLGCVMFEALTGSTPFVGENALSTLMKHQSGRIPSLKEGSLGDDFPPALENIVAKMLAKLPEERYGSLSIVAHDLGALSRQAPISIKPPGLQKGSSGSTSLFAERKTLTAVVILTALSFLVLGVFIGVSSSQWFRNASNSKSKENLTDTKISDPVANVSQQIDSKSFEELATTISTKSAPAVDLTHETEQEAKDGDDKSSLIVLKTKLLPLAVKTGALDVSDMKIKKAALELIARTPQIKRLTMDECELDNESLKLLAVMNLESISLNRSNLNNEGAKNLAANRTLVQLSLVHVKNLTDEGVTSLLMIPTLQFVNLRGLLVSDYCARVLGRCKNIRILDLSAVKGISDEGLQKLSHANITDLNLSGWDILTDDVYALSQFKKLETLRLNQSTLNGALARVLCAKTAGLRQLYVEDCSELRPADVEALKREFPSIKVIDQAKL